MFGRKFAIAGIVMAAAQPVSAVVTNFSFGGKIVGSESGLAAANDIYAVAPIGSTYSFTFSYDPEHPPAPIYSGPTYGSYVAVPVNAILTLGGSTFALPKLDISTGAGPFNGLVRFAMYGNVPLSSTTLAGYQLLDFSFTLFSADAGALPGGALPSSFDLARFSDRSIRPRFAFGPNGGTVLLLSVDIPDAAAVPEPTVWVSLIFGFFATGLALRREKHHLVV